MWASEILNAIDADVANKNRRMVDDMEDRIPGLYRSPAALRAAVHAVNTDHVLPLGIGDGIIDHRLLNIRRIGSRHYESFGEPNEDGNQE